MLHQAIKKAQQSSCRYKIAAIGFDKKGDFLGIKFNYPRISGPGGSIHAEINLMHAYGTRLKHIIIVRTNLSGDMLPIHPCKNCQKIAGKLGIKITSAKE